MEVEHFIIVVKYLKTFEVALDSSLKLQSVITVKYYRGNQEVV